MQERDIRLLFDAGAVTKASAVYTQIHNGYILAFQAKNNKELIYLEAQWGGQRIAKTLDAAAESIKRIGFKSFTVDYI